MPGNSRVLVALLLVVPAACWIIPSLPQSQPVSGAEHLLPAWQDQLLQALWHQHKDKLSFCIGADLEDGKKLLRESFPPLPSGPADDAVCSNSSLVMAHLCSPQELNFYMKVWGAIQLQCFLYYVQPGW